MLSDCHHQFDKHAWPSHRTLSVNQSGYLRRHWSFGSVLFGKGTLAAPEVNMESVRSQMRANVVSCCIVMAALFRSASSRHDQVSALKPDSNTKKDKKWIHSTWTNVRYVSTVKSLHNNVFDNFYSTVMDFCWNKTDINRRGNMTLDHWTLERLGLLDFKSTIHLLGPGALCTRSSFCLQAQFHINTTIVKASFVFFLICFDFDRETKETMTG